MLSEGAVTAYVESYRERFAKSYYEDVFRDMIQRGKFVPVVYQLPNLIIEIDTPEDMSRAEALSGVNHVRVAELVDAVSRFRGIRTRYASLRVQVSSRGTNNERSALSCDEQ